MELVLKNRCVGAVFRSLENALLTLQGPATILLTEWNILCIVRSVCASLNTGMAD